MTPEQVCETLYEASAAYTEGSRERYSLVIEPVMEWLWAGDMESITKFYEILDPTKLTVGFESCAVRAAFGHGEQIPTWNAYRLRAIEDAFNRFDEQKVKDCFLGLLDTSWTKTKSGSEGAFDRLLGIHPTFVRD